MIYDPNPIRNAFDQIAEREDQFEKGFSLRNEIPREFIKKYLKESDLALDAGGGAGINAIMMARFCQRVTLVDLSPRLLEIARSNIKDAGLVDKIKVMEGDISNLEQLQDGSFSFVICLGGTLSYLLEKGHQAIHELARVAKKGAFILIGCDSKYGFVRWLFNASDPEEQLELVAEVLEAGRYEAGENTFARLYTAGELSEMLESAGCEILEVGSTPILLSSWEQASCPEERRGKLKELELKLCTVPELVGTGHHLFCVAKKL
jgi:ubiquinone/menaquinone biosynthesis C-methylase UbiE